MFWQTGKPTHLYFLTAQRLEPPYMPPMGLVLFCTTGYVHLAFSEGRLRPSASDKSDREAYHSTTRLLGPATALAKLHSFFGVDASCAHASP